MAPSMASSSSPIQRSSSGRVIGEIQVQLEEGERAVVLGGQGDLAALDGAVEGQAQLVAHQAHQAVDLLGRLGSVLHALEQAQGGGLLQERQVVPAAQLAEEGVGDRRARAHLVAVAGAAAERRHHPLVDDAGVEAVAADGQARGGQHGLGARSPRAVPGPTRTREKSLVPPPKSATTISSWWSRVAA